MNSSVVSEYEVKTHNQIDFIVKTSTREWSISPNVLKFRLKNNCFRKIKCPLGTIRKTIENFHKLPFDIRRLSVALKKCFAIGKSRTYMFNFVFRSHVKIREL